MINVQKLERLKYGLMEGDGGGKGFKMPKVKIDEPFKDQDSEFRGVFRGALFLVVAGFIWQNLPNNNGGGFNQLQQPTQPLTDDNTGAGGRAVMTGANLTGMTLPSITTGGAAASNTPAQPQADNVQQSNFANTQAIMPPAPSPGVPNYPNQDVPVNGSNIIIQAVGANGQSISLQPSTLGSNFGQQNQQLVTPQLNQQGGYSQLAQPPVQGGYNQLQQQGSVQANINTGANVQQGPSMANGVAQNQNFSNDGFPVVTNENDMRVKTAKVLYPGWVVIDGTPSGIRQKAGNTCQLVQGAGTQGFYVCIN